MILTAGFIRRRTWYFWVLGLGLMSVRDNFRGKSPSLAVKGILMISFPDSIVKYGRIEGEA
jgi:hypothetical protein